MGSTTTKRTTPTAQRSEVDYSGMDPEMAATMKEMGVRGAGEQRPARPDTVKVTRRDPASGNPINAIVRWFRHGFTGKP